MNSRSRKYHESRKEGKGRKSQAPATNIAVSQNKKPAQQPKEIPLSKEAEPVIQKNSATQDDTGGGNDSGKRSDDN